MHPARHRRSAHRLRQAFDVAGYPWVTNHVYRLTVATLMDMAGLSARAAADQLGYVTIRCSERLGEVAAVASVGSVGDPYDNAMAEAFNSLFKAELVRNRGPWRGIDDLEVAVAEYVDWYNHRRLHGELGLIPPVEHETRHLTTSTARQPPAPERENQASIKPGT